MIINLPWKDRKVMSEVANIYCDIAIDGQEDQELIRKFWRISMYSKIGIMSRKDAVDICTAMTVFCEIYKNDKRRRDLEGVFADVEDIAGRLKALIDKKTDSQ